MHVLFLDQQSSEWKVELTIVKTDFKTKILSCNYYPVVLEFINLNILFTKLEIDLQLQHSSHLYVQIATSKV